MKYNIMCVDGNLLAHKNIRVHAKLRAKNEEGAEICTGMAYGMVRQLMSLRKRFSPRKLRVCWDSPKLIRKSLSAEYKEHREKNSDRFVGELLLTSKILQFIGVPQIRVMGFEADDILATYAKKFKKTLIVTSDKDLLQAISPTVEIYQPKGKNERIVTYESFKQEYGFEPEFWPDYQALIGDKGDNIPGVDGVGPETAMKIIQTFGGLEGILDEFQEFRNKYPKIAALMEADIHKVIVSRELAKSFDDVKLKKLYKHKPNPEALKTTLTRYQFNSFMLPAVWPKLLDLGKDI